MFNVAKMSVRLLERTKVRKNIKKPFIREEESGKFKVLRDFGVNLKT